MLSRRAILGSCLAVLAAAGSVIAHADRYQNETGLAPGRFVWSPSVSPSGPVTLVASLTGKTLHVYRRGVEIGIATIEVPHAESPPAGLFVLSGLKRHGDDTGTARLEWFGTELYTRGGRRYGEPGDAVVLPDDIDALLFEATHRGAAVIVARERSTPQIFAAAGPFVDPIETGSVNSRIGRFATPQLTPALPADPAPPAKAPSSAPPQQAAADLTGVTALVLSRADLSAHVVRDGHVVDRLPIAVDDPTRPFGLHAAVLLAPATDAAEARWMAFGLDDDAAASHVTGDSAAAALRRVRFLDRGRTATLARDLRPGTVVVLMDGHGPSVTDPPRINVALMTNAPARAELPPPAASPAPPPPVAAVEAERTRTPAAAARSTPERSRAQSKARSADNDQPVRKRRKGPLDHREDYPYSMYWPY